MATWSLVRGGPSCTPPSRDCEGTAEAGNPVTAGALAHLQRGFDEENRRWWTLGAMCFALFMIMLDNTVVNVALLSIQRDLHASLAALEWTVNAYTLTFAVLLVTGGRLGDIFGRRKMFIFGVTVFGLSSLLIGFSPSDTWLVGFRAVQGLGAAFMMPATLAIITQAFPAEQRGTAIGTWAGVSAVGLTIGPVVGGFLTEYVSWRAIFFINPPIAVVAVVATLAAAVESRDESVAHSVDLPGIVAITVGLSAFVLALVQGDSWGWHSDRIVSLLTIALAGLTAFVMIERRVGQPMVDFAFFRSRTFVGANVVAVFIAFAAIGQFFFLALYMQNVLGYSPVQTGIRFLPSTLPFVLLAPFVGRLTDRVGSRAPISIGLVIVAAGLFDQSDITVRTTYLALFPGFLLMGTGMAFVISPMTTAAMNSVDPAKAGAASGIVSMSRMIGATFGVAAMGAVVTTIGGAKIDRALPQLSARARGALRESLGTGAPHVTGNVAHMVAAVHAAFVSGGRTGLAIGAVALLVASGLALTLIERRPKTVTPRPAGGKRVLPPASRPRA